MIPCLPSKGLPAKGLLLKFMDRRIRIGVVSVLVAAAVPALIGPHVAQAASTSPSTLDLSAFSAQVETLGIAQYPNSFTGAELTSAGVTDVYLVNSASSQLVSAINSLNTLNYPVQFINVSRSYAQLD